MVGSIGALSGNVGMRGKKLRLSKILSRKALAGLFMRSAMRFCNDFWKAVKAFSVEDMPTEELNRIF